MMARPLASAALILPDYLDLDTPIYVPFAAASLAALDCPRQARARVADTGDRVSGETLMVRIRCEADSPFGPRVMLEVHPLGRPAPGDGRRASHLLKDLISRALLDCDADLIAWQSDGTLLDRTEFAALLVQGHAPEAPLPGPPDTIRHRPQSTAALAEALDHPDAIVLPEAARRRLTAAGWLMTGMVATVSLPVGAALYVHGAARGPSLRRVSHALAICGLFALMDSKGMMTGMTLAGSF